MVVVVCVSMSVADVYWSETVGCENLSALKQKASKPHWWMWETVTHKLYQRPTFAHTVQTVPHRTHLNFANSKLYVHIQISSFEIWWMKTGDDEPGNTLRDSFIIQTRENEDNCLLCHTSFFHPWHWKSHIKRPLPLSNQMSKEHLWKYALHFCAWSPDNNPTALAFCLLFAASCPIYFSFIIS